MTSATSIVTSPSHEVRPLRFPVVPFVDESLPGLVARATREHVLESTAIVLERAGIQALHPGTVCLAPAVELKSLARALRCDEEAVLYKAHWYCGERKRGGPVRFGDGVVYREDLLLERRRIAPLTLEGAEHHRAWWLIGLLPYCPISLERLVDHCPRCPDKRLGWRRSWGIAHCEWCGETVPPSEDAPLAPELVEGYRLFANLLSLVPHQRGQALSALSAEARALDAQTLLNCMLQVGATCRSDPILLKRNAVCSLPAAKLASVVSVGAEMMCDWPTSIRDWSRQEFGRLEPDYQAISALRASLRRLGLPRSAGPAQLQFVRRALPDMFGSFDRSFADTDAIVLVNEAARITGLDCAEIRSLQAAKLLASHFEHGSKRARRQYLKAEVINLANALRGSKPATFLEWRLGLPRYAIEQLCCVGLVEQEDHAAVMFLRPELQLRYRSIAGLFAKLDTSAAASPPPIDTVPLSTAARRIGGRLKPWAAIVAALLDGSLAYWIGEGPRYVRMIKVRRSDMVRFDQVNFDQERYPNFRFSAQVTQRDAEEILNIDGPQMAKVREEIFPNFKAQGTSLRIGRSDVLAVAERLIATSELAERADVDPRLVPRLLTRLEIPKVAFGWERSKVSGIEEIARLI